MRDERIERGVERARDHRQQRDRHASAWISGYGTESFVWDAFDRLRTRTSWAGTDSYSYDGTHRLASINGPSGFRSYTHDARGNVTGRPGYTHSFDAVNRLVQSQPVGGSVETYEYDGHGRRTGMVRSNGSIKVDYYTRDGVLRATADTGIGSTGGSAVYVHLGDVLVAQDAWAWRSPFGMTYFHVDHQGTPIARSDAWGTVFERTRRGSFGLPLVGPLKNGPGYTGHMEDPGTGLVYMQQRYYDPAIARFLSVDPVGPLADPTNHFGRYHYGLNNPYRFTDPDGRLPLDTLIDVGYVIYDGGRFLGAAAAAGVGAATGNEALTREGLAGMGATGADLATSAVSAVTPYASAPMARMGRDGVAAVGNAAKTASRMGDFKKASSHQLKGVDEHAFKKSVMGETGSVKTHNISLDKEGNVVLTPVQKGGPVMQTGYRLNELRDEFPEKKAG